MPVTMTVQFMNSGMADLAQWIPEVRRTDALTVSYQSDDYIKAVHCMTAVIFLAGQAA